MKITLTKKRGKVTSVRFTASRASKNEGVHLKDIVLAAAKAKPNELVTGAIDQLGNLGYEGGLTKETRNTREFTLKRKAPASDSTEGDGLAGAL